MVRPGTPPRLKNVMHPRAPLAVVEPQDAVLQALLRIGLQSPTGMIRLIVQQSNCFQIVEAARLSRNPMQERAGCRRPDAGWPGTGKGQMVGSGRW